MLNANENKTIQLRPIEKPIVVSRKVTTVRANEDRVQILRRHTSTALLVLDVVFQEETPYNDSF